MRHHNTRCIEISRMTQDVSQEAFSLACEVFVKASPLHTAMKVTIEEYRDYMALSFVKMRTQNLSLIATDTKNNDLVGCIVACDYATQGQCTVEVPQSLKPINALLNTLDEKYRQDRRLQKGQCLLVDMAVVTPSARGQGIYRRLREAAHQIGREAGFSCVVGELSSTTTQRGGRFPFSSIKSPKSIVLVEGEL